MIFFSIRKYFLFIPFFVLTWPVNLARAEPVGFENAFPVTPRTIAVGEFFISKENAPYIFIIFSEKSAAKQDIYLSYAKRGNLSFTKPLRIRKINNDLPIFPTIAASSSTAVALWQEETTNGFMRIHYMTIKIDPQNDKKINLSDPKALEHSAPGATDSFLGLVSASRNNNYNVFFHKKSDRTIILYHLSLNAMNGQKGVPAPLPQVQGLNSRGNFFPSILRFGNTMYVAWQTKALEKKKDLLNDEIFFLRSSNNGRTWSRPLRLTSNEHADFTPHLFLFGGFPAVVYSSRPGKSWQVYLKYQRAGSWTNPILISHTSSNTFKPTGAIYNDKLNILWYDFRKGRPAIFFQDIEIYDDDRNILPETGLKNNIQKNDKLFSTGKGSHSEPHIIRLGRRIALIWKRVTGGKGRLYAKLADISAPAIKILSKTHPEKPPYWTNKTGGFIFWKKPTDPSGIKGYAFLISSKADEIPLVQTHGPDTTSIKFSNLPAGKNWAHIRVIDHASNLGPVARFPLWIDTSGPKILDIKSSIPKNTPSSVSNVGFSWTMENTQEIKLYKLELYHEDKLVKKLTSKFNKISFTNLQEGKWSLWVKGVDFAGNTGNILEYPFILFVDENQPKAPDVVIENLKDNFFISDQKFLRLLIKPRISKSPFSATQVAITHDRYDITDFTTLLPESRIKLNLDRHKGFYWLRIKINYRDGRISRTKALPFFYGSEAEYIQALKVHSDSKKLNIFFKESLRLGNSKVVWEAFRKREDKKVKYSSGTAKISDIISYKKFPKGNYSLEYFMKRPDGKKTPLREYAFVSNYKITRRRMREIPWQVADTWQVYLNQSLFWKKVINEEEMTVILERIKEALKGEDFTFGINLRNFHYWMFLITIPAFLLIVFVTLLLSSTLFKFIVDGILFRFRWRLGWITQKL